MRMRAVIDFAVSRKFKQLENRVKTNGKCISAIFYVIAAVLSRRAPYFGGVKILALFCLSLLFFQGTSVGNPAMDLSKLIISGLSPADRRANTDKLLEEYYATYVKALDGKAAPFSFEQVSVFNFR